MTNAWKTLGLITASWLVASAAAAPRDIVTAPATINVYGSEEVWGGEVNPLNTPFTFTLTPGYSVARIQFNAQVVVSDLEWNFAADLAAMVTPPGRDPVFVKLLPDTSQPAGTVMFTAMLRELDGGPYQSDGEWTIKLLDVFPSDVTGQTIECVVSGLQIVANDPVVGEPSGVIDLGAITDSRQVAGAIAPFGVQWYKFSTQRVDSADGQFLDIFVRPESSDNLMLILCNAAGFPEDYDFSRGVGNRGLLSFGVGGGAANSAGTALGTSDLRPGTYYLGVVRQPAIENIFNPINNEFNPWNIFPYVSGPASDFTLQFSKGDFTPVAPVTLETFTAAAPLVTRELTFQADEVKWYRIDATGIEISPETNRYLDIAVSSEELFSVQVALYSADGTFVKGGWGSNVGAENRITISLGAGSGLPLGRFFDVDPIFGGGAERTIASTGQAGSLVGGVYYLAVNTSLYGSPRDGFRVYSDAEEPSPAGAATLSIRAGTRTAVAPIATNLGTLTTGVASPVSIDSGQVRWYTFTLPAAATKSNTRYLDIRTTSIDRDTSLALFSADGRRIAFDENDGVDANGWLSFGVGSSTELGDWPLAAGRDGDLNAGVYYLAVMPGQSSAADRFTATPMDDEVTGDAMLIVSVGERTATPPATSDNLGSVSNGVYSHVVAVPDGQSAWLRFTLDHAVTAANGRYLEVFSTTLNGEEIRFPSLAVYDMQGVRKAIISPLSSTTLRGVFGAGPSFTIAPGEPLWWNPLGDLPAGEYYLAIAPGETAWGPLFECAPQPGEIDLGGGITLTFSEGERMAIPAPAATSLGTLSGNQTVQSTIVANTPVNWFTFTLENDLTSAGAAFLDIDALGTSADGLSRNCAGLAIYTTDGRLVARQGYNDWLFRPGFSFGAATPLRPLGGTFYTDDVARGQSGPLAAGTYILGVAQLGMFFEDGFQFRQRVSLDVGARLTLNVRMTAAAVSTGCQPADIACDDGTPLPADTTVHPNGGVNEGDYNSFFQGFFDAASNCDIANDDATPRAPFGVNGVNGGVNEGDYNCFFQRFFNGCPL